MYGSNDQHYIHKSLRSPFFPSAKVILAKKIKCIEYKLMWIYTWVCVEVIFTHCHDFVTYLFTNLPQNHNVVHVFVAIDLGFSFWININAFVGAKWKMYPCWWIWGWSVKARVFFIDFQWMLSALYVLPLIHSRIQIHISHFIRNI